MAQGLRFHQSGEVEWVADAICSAWDDDAEFNDSLPYATFAFVGQEEQALPSGETWYYDIYEIEDRRDPLIDYNPTTLEGEWKVRWDPDGFARVSGLHGIFLMYPGEVRADGGEPP